jgi:hypothetical protein
MKFLKFHEFLDRGGMLCPWGQKWGFWAVIDVCWVWVTIVTDAASLSHLDSDEASNTFLVLGPIDLTNGRAGMIDVLLFTLRGKINKVKKM